MSLHCSRCGRAIELPGVVASFCAFCGQPLSGGATTVDEATLPSAPGSRAAPARIGEYRLVRRLGQGGMGTVYEAEHAPTGRRVAVKLIDAEASAEALERFRREGRLASTITHPRCVFVLAADAEASQPYLVMELMPGRSLSDLVREHGPLPLDEALRHALDVIDGLEQVHRLSVIHRDIKPSNCFLGGDGRVKVGDFGLARTLRGARLTQTGVFVGTPLFASPEQVKCEPLDARTDIYAVCATLYFLLTGRAPHDGSGDALAVMARVIGDEAPPLRRWRPDLPRGLERTLARGLARDRAQRWPDLASLRSALTGFQVAPAGLGILGRRLAAYLCDMVLLGAVYAIALLPFFPEQILQPSRLYWLLGTAAGLVYLGLWEGLAGLTPGKWLLGLRVVLADDVIAPGWRRGLLRALTYQLLLFGPTLNLLLEPQTMQWGAARLVLQQLLFVAGMAAMLSTVRRRNGGRCLHDLLSGTRVILPPPAVSAVRFPAATAPAATHPDDLPACLGPFVIQGEYWRCDGDRILGSVDAGLDRPVWVWQRPADRPALPEPRRELVRVSRLRWLAAGEQDGQRWDAFVRPAGAPLLETVRQGGPLEWPAAREFLEALSDELIEAQRDGTLPTHMSLSQVWALPSGQPVLLDVPGPEAPTMTPLALLAATAFLLLDGEPCADVPSVDGLTEQPLPRRPLPMHVRQLLAQLPLFGGELHDLSRFREQLAGTHNRAVRVSRVVRTLQLVVLFGAQFTCCCSCFGWMGLLFTGWGAAVATHGTCVEADQMLAELDRSDTAQLAALVAPAPDPLSRMAPLASWRQHRLASARLRAARDSARRYSDARQEHVLGAGLMRQALDKAMRQAMDNPSGQPPPFFIEVPRDKRAELLTMRLRSEAGPDPRMLWFSLAGLGVTILVCLFSAAAFRGGLRYLMFGVRVVRRDGQPSGRLRCTGRALAAWIVCIGPLVVARLLEEQAWQAWTPAGGPGAGLALANGCWAVALSIIAVWLVVLIAMPARSLHDRLAGTWLVPR